MPKRRDSDKIDRGENNSKINIQKINNGLYLDLVQIAKEHGQQLPTFLRPFLRELRERHSALLSKPQLD